MIGIVSALAAEATLLSRAIDGHPATPLRVSVAGPGTANAERAALELIADGARGLMSWGVAAALHPSLSAGQVLLPRCIVHQRESALRVDRGWHARAVKRTDAGLGAVVEPLAHTDLPLRDSADKQALGKALGAVAADMESFAVGRAASRQRLPFLVVRSVVDTLPMRVPSAAIHAVNVQGGYDWPRLLAACARHPAVVVELVALGWAFAKARRSLGRIVEPLVRDGLGFEH